MSLEGTLETIALPDVLALLSVTAKSGELRVEAGGGAGSIWFDAGRLAGYEVGSHRTPVDALFALLRLSEGSFKFHTGVQPHNAIAPEEVAPLLEEAESRLMQWPGIAAVVPSLFCELRLEDSIDASVTLRPDQWQLVATIGGGRPVVEVLSLRNLGEYDGCRAVKELVDLNLVRVGDAGAPSEVPFGDEPFAEASFAEVPFAGVPLADAPAASSFDLSEPPPPPASDEAVQWHEADAPDGREVADLSEVWDGEPAPVAVATEQVEAKPAAEPEAPGQPVNRGLLLKFLGSARN
ncbi:MAG TPA: DUF4388 domain-containing protein [Acidimicrobiales bacterium]|nr:DUF4388 domain-containing protein [Acidimicrobiales bacterium]